jgi:hypothetical protein
MGSFETKVVAQAIEQRCARLDVERVVSAVDV